MKVKPDFENLLKTINPDLSVKIREGAKVGGIYWKDYDLGVAIPAEEIKEDIDVTHCDDYGTPHRTQKTAIQMVKATLDRMVTDKDFYEFITDTTDYMKN